MRNETEEDRGRAGCENERTRRRANKEISPKQRHGCRVVIVGNYNLGVPPPGRYRCDGQLFDSLLVHFYVNSCDGVYSSNERARADESFVVIFGDF